MTCDDNPYICTQARLGDVGGNSLGYIGGCWSVCGEKLASQSFDGALQLWSHSDSDGQSVSFNNNKKVSNKINR